MEGDDDEKPDETVPANGKDGADGAGGGDMATHRPRGADAGPDHRSPHGARGLCGARRRQ
ncbi:hypothetical protein [Rhizobium leguminosarum]|uniref:hypothetical protein n=1 Tax=Rhizobium leguminosarum TaxID=384 RepID=UPI0021B1466C|nr:hypothetical protein [Rhizobium leguminosarum]